MKKFIVERNLPGAGILSPEELKAISKTSCEVVNQTGNPYHRIQSFVTDDKIYCIHIAENEAVVRKHSRLGKCPINKIAEVKVVIDSLAGNLL